MLTKKHYEVLANLIRRHTEWADISLGYMQVLHRREFVDALEAWLTDDNPRFDVDRFRAACGGGP